MTDNKKDMRDTYTIYDDQTIGKVQIADEVVAIIAGLAATEVEGVASMAGAKIAYFAEAEVMNRFINPDTKINTSISGIGPMFSS